MIFETSPKVIQDIKIKNTRKGQDKGKENLNSLLYMTETCKKKPARELRDMPSPQESIICSAAQIEETQ
jgi:hypothetical protein